MSHDWTSYATNSKRKEERGRNKYANKNNDEKKELLFAPVAINMDNNIQVKSLNLLTLP